MMLRMPYGLKNAPATFQRAMNNIFETLSPQDFRAFLDDLTLATSLEEHIKIISDMFSLCRSNGVNLNPKKCLFLTDKGVLLGHQISEKGIQIAPEKLAVVLDLPIPKTLKQIKGFVATL